MAKGTRAATPKEYIDPKWDLETLTRAEQIKANAKRMAAAQKEAEKQREALSRIAKSPAPSKTSRLANKRI